MQLVTVEEEKTMERSCISSRGEGAGGCTGQPGQNVSTGEFNLEI